MKQTEKDQTPMTETPLSKKFYRISEVSQMLGIPATTLRWWDREFEQLNAYQKDGKGWRKYSPEDIELLRRIADLLYNQGLSTEAAKRKLNETQPNKHPIHCRTSEQALRLIERLKEVAKDNPQAIVIADALRRWIQRESKGSES